jgi:hypothetical protein
MSFKYLITTAFIFLNLSLVAQTTIQTNNIVAPTPIYFGGGIVLGGGSGSFQMGLNPELVKSYNQYIDLGLAMNLYYSSYKLMDMNGNIDARSNNTQFGLGGFLRAWPIEQFFIQVQPEYNWTFTNAKSYINGSTGSSNVSAPSVLAGIGYGKRNEHGFTYFSVMFDLVNSLQSPYRMGQLTAQPILRAGVGFPIFTSKKKEN